MRYYHQEPETVIGQYDLVLDSFCLQSIVLDKDRRAVFAAVRTRLRGGGFYVISTAVYSPSRDYGDDHFFDEDTGICYHEVFVGLSADAVKIVDRWYIPHQRHLTPEALRVELTAAGFHVQDLAGLEPGEVVCRFLA